MTTNNYTKKKITFTNVMPAGRLEECFQKDSIQLVNGLTIVQMNMAGNIRKSRFFTIL